MTRRLYFEAILKFTAGVFLVAVLLFLPAGTVDYPGGWLLMGILFIPMFLAGLVMMAVNPGLLRSRLNAKEKEREQDLVVKLSGLMFLVGFILAGLDFRFGWSNLPFAVNCVGAVLFLLAYALYAEVLRENTWLSRTIEVQEGQTVVSTGLYGIVRHPMYAVTLLLFLSMPIVLGSVPAFLVFLCYPLIIAKRIKNEEKVLSRDLPGYAEYLQRVRWRLIPYIW
ncbi:MAG: isoprenylcysteine carboxylmethyltransferase family protein [Oscillospiraceae bacterium]|nr:isoprenylcysteine carboxylmethyltransferase family protein [Oscillospiraceae bacterium]